MRDHLTRIATVIASGLLVAVVAVPADAAVVVASIDQGIVFGDPVLAGKIAPGGFDFVNNDNVPESESATDHGNVIAKILATKNDATLILPLKTRAGDGDPHVQPLNDAALNYVNSLAAVRVVDLSSTYPVTASILQATAQTKAVVVSAGNEGQSSPQGTATLVPLLGGRGIIVGAINNFNQPYPNSNLAGGLAQHYVVAPGFNVFSDIRGTSFAKPHVSATIALLLDTFDNLTPADAIEIIKTTADDLGAPGVDSTFGHGALNVQAAMNPVGQPGVGGGGSSSSSGAAAALALGLGAAITVAVRNRGDELKKTLIHDRFDRPYLIDLRELMSVRDERGSLARHLAASTFETRSATLLDTPEWRMEAVVSEPPARDRFEYREHSVFDTGDGDDYTDAAFSIAAAGARWDYLLGMNTSTRHEFGAMSLLDSDLRGATFYSEAAMSAPLMGFTMAGTSAKLGYALDDEFSVSLGLSSNDDGERYGQTSDAVLFEGSWTGERFAAGITLGHLSEDGSLFGGSSDGPMSVEQSDTTSLTLSAGARIGERSMVFASVTEGYTRVHERANSLMQDFSSLRSDTYALGFMSRDLWRRDDLFGVALTQPLRVTEGDVELRVPSGLGAARETLYESGRIALDAFGAERTLEGFYRLPTGRDTTLTTRILYQEEPLHDPQAADRFAFMTVLERKF